MTEVPEPAVEGEIRPEIVEELRQLEKVITTSNSDGIIARWKSGRQLRRMREGKGRLPNRQLAQLAQELGVHASELTARMKFAGKYATETELTDVVSKFASWHAIVHQALTTKPRKAAPVEDDVEQAEVVGPNKADLKCVILILDRIIDNIATEQLDAEDIAPLSERVVRLKEAVAILAKPGKQDCT
jgi:hypothetical protein